MLTLPACLPGAPEGTEQHFSVEDFGPGLGWYVKVSSFSNQAMWMASREQVSTTTSLSLSRARSHRGRTWLAGEGPVITSSWLVLGGGVLQVKFFNSSCNERFFPPWGPGWVEYWR